MRRDSLTGPRIHLVQLAGGRGLRAGGGPGVKPKQFRSTGRGPLLTVSLREFISGQAEYGYQVVSVTVVVPDDWRPIAASIMAKLLPPSESIPWALAAAGSSRTASTWHALSLLASGKEGLTCPHEKNLVVIHDAARPFATAALLARLVTAALNEGGAVPGVPVPDTVVQMAGGDPACPTKYLPRERLMAVQTPQVFGWGPCLAAHRRAADKQLDFTDDGGLLAASGQPPAVVAGDPGNWKVTTEDDWQRAWTYFEKQGQVE